ncbi:hypothetical protein GBAR_LOCUS15826 [Geodia barretti]|uniref:Uncharacterized protein n=1 Tax=Geodia barretti TaxID=519541 RepID=A0AA35SD04_GEOBA|nr:hypothetical protein GBAR_LOCUS15826 [Geodia barretti]
MKGRYGFDISLDTDHPQYSKTPHSPDSKSPRGCTSREDADILSPLPSVIEGLQRMSAGDNSRPQTTRVVAEKPPVLHQTCRRTEEKWCSSSVPFVRFKMDGCAFFGTQLHPDQRLFIALPFSNLQRYGDSLFTALLKFHVLQSDSESGARAVGSADFRVEL